MFPTVPSDEMRSASALLHEMMNLGEAMLSVGGEVSRVEDTLERLGTAYGADRTNVFVITSSMVITIVFPDGRELTQTRRIVSSGSTNFAKLEALNALSRRCCVCPLSTGELRSAIDRIMEQRPSSLRFYLGSVLAAAAFAVFFGGRIYDGFAAALIAVFICFMQQHLPAVCSSRVVFHFLISLLTGLMICVLSALLPALHMDKVMIGDIMLLIPGIAMTSSVRDLLIGDTIAGMFRLIETLLWAIALACGFMIAIMLV